MKESKTSTVFIRGLPFSVKDEQLTETFKEYGKIRQSFVTKPKGHNANTQIGYVKFTAIEEATAAINSIKSIDGKNIQLTYARKKPRKYRQPAPKENEEEKGSSGLSDSDDDVVRKPVPNHVTKDKENPKNSLAIKTTPSLKTKSTMGYSTANGVQFPRNKTTIYISNLPSGLNDKDVRKKCRKIGVVSEIVVDDTSAAVTFKDEASAKTAVKKLNRHVFKQSVITVVLSTISDKAIKKMNSPSRIIIRNLNFKVTEDVLKTELLVFGKLLDLEIPKKDNGAIKGFAFVSFINKFEANKAIQKLNGKSILGRKVAVDWAVTKDEYSKNKENKVVEENTDTIDNSEVSDIEDAENDEMTKEDNSEEETDVPGDEANGSDNDNSEDDEINDEIEESEFQPVKKEYDDVKEGRTIFMGNLPFDVEKEDIEEAFSVFGGIRYVRMVHNVEKDRPKGIAFLQFHEKADAERCLARTKLQSISIAGRSITVNPATDKKETANDKFPADQKSKTGKDNRNLHLAMEGVIKEGTNAAAGVSKTDMMKRKLALEAKKKKLKNINCFVSTTRLCVRNMPPKVNEVELKKIMSKYGNVSQVKIMRDIKHANSEGIGKSKGYGFVQFSKHEAALAALRATNNNPSIFSAAKRPIVDFSIENSTILSARAKKFSDPTPKPKGQKTSFNQRWKDKREARKADGNTKKVAKQSTEQPIKQKAAEDKPKKGKRKKVSNVPTETTLPSAPSALDNAESTRVQGKQPKKNKSERPQKKQKRDKEHTEEAAFQKLVQSYKGKLESVDQTYKRWYE